MASQSGSETQGEQEAATRKVGGPMFPLGYKDAAYQWVSPLRHRELFIFCPLTGATY